MANSVTMRLEWLLVSVGWGSLWDLVLVQILVRLAPPLFLVRCRSNVGSLVGYRSNSVVLLRRTDVPQGWVFLLAACWAVCRILGRTTDRYNGKLLSDSHCRYARCCQSKPVSDSVVCSCLLLPRDVEHIDFLGLRWGVCKVRLLRAFGWTTSRLEVRKLSLMSLPRNVQ